MLNDPLVAYKKPFTFLERAELFSRARDEGFSLARIAAAAKCSEASVSNGIKIHRFPHFIKELINNKKVAPYNALSAKSRMDKLRYELSLSSEQKKSLRLIPLFKRAQETAELRGNKRISLELLDRLIDETAGVRPTSPTIIDLSH